MTVTVQRAIEETNAARARVLHAVEGVPDRAGLWRPGPEEWSIAEVLEHLVLAELGGINRIWRAAVSTRAGTPEWSGEHIHRGKSIERVIDETWQAREAAPEVAVPRWGGPAAYWAAALEACGVPLDRLAPALEGLDLDTVVYPHPISGPLDAGQRLAFLRFHLDRHAGQIDRIMTHPQFPASDRQSVTHSPDPNA